MSTSSAQFDPDFDDDEDAPFGDLAPWNPSSIVYNAFFCGPLPAGLLFAYNARRLGRPAAFVPGLVIALVAGLGLPALVFFYLNSRGPIDSQDARLGVRIAGVLFALAWARVQRTRFEVFSRDGDEAASLWKPGFIALAVGLVIHIAWMAVLMPWLEFEFEDR